MGGIDSIAIMKKVWDRVAITFYSVQNLEPLLN